MNLGVLPAPRTGDGWRGCGSADAMAPYSRVVLRASIYLPPVDRWVEGSDLSFCDAFRVQDNPRASTRGFLFFRRRVFACSELRATSVSGIDDGTSTCRNP